WDEEFGGTYWMVDHLGNPGEKKKKILGGEFTLYGLGGAAPASGKKEPVKEPLALHQIIEDASHDGKNGGYFETYERDWRLAGEQRLSEVDMDEQKSMNTHLHLLEAYANLRRTWNDDALRKRLRELVRIFLDHIIDPETHHFRMFFDEVWHDHSDRFSLGMILRGVG